jgi:hypothetical protein
MMIHSLILRYMHIFIYIYRDVYKCSYMFIHIYIYIYTLQFLIKDLFRPLKHSDVLFISNRFLIYFLSIFMHKSSNMFLTIFACSSSSSAILSTRCRKISSNFMASGSSRFFSRSGRYYGKIHL